MAARTAIPRARPLHSPVNDGVSSGDNLVHRLDVTQFARQPFDGRGAIFEPVPVAARAIPAAQMMTGAGKMTHDIAAEKSSRSRYCDFHEAPPSL